MTPRTDDIWNGYLYAHPYLSKAVDETRLIELECDKYRRVLELIRDYGGKRSDAEGLSMNGSWCAEQADTVLCPKGEDGLDLGMPATWHAMGNENDRTERSAGNAGRSQPKESNGL